MALKFRNSTIVRIRNRRDGCVLPLRRAPAARPGRAARRDLWFTAPPRMTELPVPDGRRAVRGRGAGSRGARPGVGRRSRLGSVRRGRSTWCTAGAGVARSSVRWSSRSWSPATGWSCSTRRRTATPTTARRARGAPTGGVREGAGRGLLQVRAGGGRDRALARHHRDLPGAAVRLARHEEAGASSRPWSSRSRCSTSSRPRWASVSAPDGRSTARSSTSSASRWPSSTPASRQATSTRCPRWSSPTAATARRRTTTSWTSRVDRRGARHDRGPRAPEDPPRPGGHRACRRVRHRVGGSRAARCRAPPTGRPSPEPSGRRCAPQRSSRDDYRRGLLLPPRAVSTAP